MFFDILRGKKIEQKERTLSQSWYGAFIGIFCAVYGGFFCFFYSNAENLYNSLKNFELTFYVKVLIALIVACAIMWILLFFATIWRGNDIGFPFIVSIFVYLLPTIPRMIGMSAWGQEVLNVLECIATFLFLVMCFVYLWLPTGWAKTEGKAKLKRCMNRIKSMVSNDINSDEGKRKKKK